MALHISMIDRSDLPAACVRECSASGDVSEAVAHWRKRLGFQVDLDAARDSIVASGSHTAREVAEMDEDRLTDRILWDAACTFAEGDDLLVLSDYKGEFSRALEEESQAA